MTYHSKPKYKNTKVECDGLKFDSKLELNIYKILKETGHPYVTQPKYLLQPKFKLNGKPFREINYIADFDIRINDTIYTIDAKGLETQVFKIKAKMFAHQYGREIILIKSAKAFREWIEKTKEGKTNG